MPHTARTFAAKHNHKLSGPAASKAAAQATAMERAGVKPGVAIAVANKTGDRMLAKQRHPGATPRTPAEQMGARKADGATYREIAGEHGTSKSSAHRAVTGAAMNRGYTREKL
jgi:hypothetical protein